MADELDEVRAALAEAQAQRAALEASELEREASARAPLKAAAEAKRSALEELTREVEGLEAEATRLAVTALAHETAITQASYRPSPLRHVPMEVKTALRWIIRSLLMVVYLWAAVLWPGASPLQFGLTLVSLPLAVLSAWMVGRVLHD